MIIFVDFENVGDQGLKGIESLIPYSKVLIVTASNRRVDINMLAEATAKNINVYFKRLKINTKQAVDVWMVQRINALNYPSSLVAVVSADKDFKKFQDSGVKIDFIGNTIKAVLNKYIQRLNQDTKLILKDVEHLNYSSEPSTIDTNTLIETREHQ